MRTSTKTVYRLIWPGTKAVDIGTGRWPRLRVARAEYEAFIRNRAIG